MTWFGICITYLRFYAGMKAQGRDRKTMPFASATQPFAAWYGMIASFVICFVSLYSLHQCFNRPDLDMQFSGWSVFLEGNWDQATFVTNYFPLMLFPVMYIGAKFVYRQPWVKPKDMDFVTNIAEIEAET